METLKFVFTSTFYPPYHIGGDAIHVYYLANELAKRNHDVHVIHLLDSYSFKKKSKPKNEYNNHENINLHSIKSPYGILSLTNAYISGKSIFIDKKVKSILEKTKPDILHHHNIAGFGPSLLKYTGDKTFYTAHDYWLLCPMNNLMKKNGVVCKGYFSCFVCPLSYYRPPQIWRYINNSNKILKKVNIIIAPSNYLKKRFLEFGIKKNITVIANFIFDTESKDEKPYDFPYFLYVGVLENHKGILKLTETFSDLKKRINAKLVIVGAGSLYPVLQKTINLRNCSEKIILLGRVDDKKLITLYKNALAVIIPSIWHENNPYVALEALSHGTPIIVSDMGGLPEIAEKGDMPIYKNDQELGLILEKVEKSQVTYKNPRKVYEEYYSPDSFILQYFKLIKNTKSSR